jgi:hypothetical protein
MKILPSRSRSTWASKTNGVPWSWSRLWRHAAGTRRVSLVPERFNSMVSVLLIISLSSVDKSITLLHKLLYIMPHLISIYISFKSALRRIEVNRKYGKSLEEIKKRII